MQEKVNKLTKIKERIIYFVENQSIKKGLFFDKIGVSSANFRGNAINTPLNSNTIEILITNYPQINLHWLITGKGEMLLQQEETNVLNEPKTAYQVNNSVKVLEETIATMKEKEAMKEEIIEMLREKLQFVEEKLHNCEQQKKLLADIKKMD